MLSKLLSRKQGLPAAGEALPGRGQKMPVPAKHFVNGNALQPPFPAGLEQAVFGLGCFWGAERKFWQAPGVYATAVGYAGGITPNPTYQETCTGRSISCISTPISISSTNATACATAMAIRCAGPPR